MKIAIVLGILVIAISTANSTISNNIIPDLEWILFKIEFNKTYKNEKEELYRKKVFLENTVIIAKHNELYEKGLETYELGINTYSDLTHQEFVTKMNGFRRIHIKHHHIESAYSSTPGNVKVPNEIDYRTRGYVTPVNNQGWCASDWAFSATGALEGQNYRLTKKLLPLSVQNLIDCSTVYGNNGCKGGTVDNALRYVSENSISSEQIYPYEAKDGKCRYNVNDTAVSTGHGFAVQYIAPGETALKLAVGRYGPVSAAIDARPSEFKSYKSGVYHNAACSSTDLNHAVLVVGYGTAGRGDYWIVKNSWGPEWGDNGYVLMARNRNNTCGIATSASVPAV